MTHGERPVLSHVIGMTMMGDICVGKKRVYIYIYTHTHIYIYMYIRCLGHHAKTPHVAPHLSLVKSPRLCPLDSCMLGSLTVVTPLGTPSECMLAARSAAGFCCSQRPSRLLCSRGCVVGIASWHSDDLDQCSCRTGWQSYTARRAGTWRQGQH